MLRFALVLAAAAALAAPARAQFIDAFWRDDFAVSGAYPPTTSFRDFGTVRATATDGAGGHYVGGDFSRLDGVEAKNVAYWTGADWQPLGGGLVSTTATYDVAVYALVVAPDGALWAAGRFDRAVQSDGSTLDVSNLARWDGAAWQNVGTPLPGLSGQAFGRALVVHDGAVVLGGDFDRLQNPDGTVVQTGSVARWTGATWEGLGAPLGTAALAVLPTGELVRGNGGVQKRVGDEWVELGGGLFGTLPYVNALAVGHGRLYVGGGQFFGGLNADGSGVFSPNVIAWNGAAWESVGGGVMGGFGLDGVTSLRAEPGGGLLVAGRFDSVGPDSVAVPTDGLARWDGTAWEALASDGTFSAHVAPFGNATLVSNGYLMTSGNPTTRAAGVGLVADGADAVRPLGRSGADGVRWAGILRPTCAGGVLAVGRDIGPMRDRVARWDGAAWQSVPTALAALPLVPRDGSSIAQVYRVASVPGACDALVVAGDFAGVPGAEASANVVRWTGTAWEALGRGANREVYHAAVADDGTVYIAGYFEAVYQADGTPVAVEGLARWTDADGWQPMGRVDQGPFAVGQPTALLADADGVTVGGLFSRAVDPDGTVHAAGGVARWTGTGWQTFGGPLPPIGSGPPIVFSLAQWNGRLVVGGDFETVERPDGSTLAAQNVATWDGTAWAALGDRATATTILYDADGLLVAADPLEVWDGAAWQRLGSGVYGSVSGLQMDDGRLYVSGSFTLAGGLPSPFLAAYDLALAVDAAPAPAAPTGRLALAVAPNPASGAATLSFTLGASAHVRAVVVDALGREVFTAVDAERAAGTHAVALDTRRLPAGVYIVRLMAGREAAARTVTVVR